MVSSLALAGAALVVVFWRQALQVDAVAHPFDIFLSTGWQRA